MSFLPKSPLISSEAKTIPASIPSGTRALFARNDGWYEMDSKGNVKKISPDGNNSSETVYIKMIGTSQNKDSEIILLEFPDGGEENGWEEVKVNYEEIETLYNSGKNICIEFELRHYLQSTTSSNILPTTSFCKLQLDTINTGKGYAYFSNIINIPNVYNDFDKNYVLIVKFEKNKDVDAVLYKLNDMRQIKEKELIATGQAEVTFDGKVEEVEVYNVSHTFNEILTAYNEGKKILLNLDITNIENTNLLLPLIAINETDGCIFAQSFSYPQKENINNFHVGWHSNDVISLLRTELASQFYVDDAPEENSTNLITSGGVFEALQNYVFYATVNIYPKSGDSVSGFDPVEITEAFNDGRMVIAKTQIVYWNDDGETEDIHSANLICTSPNSFFGVSNANDHVFIENHGNDWVCFINEAVSKYYVDTAIGDIESSLENIITKYNIGGEAS